MLDPRFYVTRLVVWAVALAAVAVLNFAGPAIYTWYVLNFTDHVAFSVPK